MPEIGKYSKNNEDVSEGQRSQVAKSGTILVSKLKMVVNLFLTVNY